MSIHDAVNALCGEGGPLHRLQPTGRLAGPERRVLCLSDAIHGYFLGPPQDDAHAAFQTRALPYLVAFVQEELFTVRVGQPRKRETTQLARLSRVVWEIRCVEAGPPIRVLGCFAAKDLFVALRWVYRNPMGKYGSAKWLAAITRCEADWHALFPRHEPLIEGASPDDYISGAVPC